MKRRDFLKSTLALAAAPVALALPIGNLPLREGRWKQWEGVKFTDKTIQKRAILLNNDGVVSVGDDVAGAESAADPPEGSKAPPLSAIKNTV